jgi:hypothetical protein
LLVDVALVVLGQLDVVLDLLVRDDASDEQLEQGAVRELCRGWAPGRVGDFPRVDTIGNTPVSNRVFQFWRLYSNRPALMPVPDQRP